DCQKFLGDLQCNACGLKNHVIILNEEDGEFYQRCSSCGKTSQVDIKRTEDGIFFKCGDCNKEYGSAKDLQMHKVSHMDDARLNKFKLLYSPRCLIFLAINSSDIKGLTKNEIIMWINIFFPIYKQNVKIPDTAEISKRQEKINNFLINQKIESNPSFIYTFMPEVNKSEAVWSIKPCKYSELVKIVKDVYFKFSVKLTEEFSSKQILSETLSAVNPEVNLQNKDCTNELISPDKGNTTSILKKGIWLLQMLYIFNNTNFL
ncbi:unnamed protein product, partial [Meganyctiphanes norvegica]